MPKKEFEPKYYRIESSLYADLLAIKEETGKKEIQLINEAIKLYRDFHYMQNKACFINEQIVQVIQASCNMMESSINQKTNRVLSELAIQTAIQNYIIAESLNLKENDIANFRMRAVDFLKQNNRVLRLDEIVNE